jgi:hypothetical protein
MVIWKLPAELAHWVNALSQPLHGRHAGRLLPLLAGLLFARGRRTVTSWLRAAAIGRGFQRYYYFLGSLGRKADFVASLLLRLAASRLPLGERVVLGLDDSPTKRQGPCVEGAGVHHNPTPGRAGQPGGERGGGPGSGGGPRGGGAGLPRRLRKCMGSGRRRCATTGPTWRPTTWGCGCTP